MGSGTIDDAPEAVRDLALGCSRFVRDALGVELDFTPDTLPILDHYLLQIARDLGARDEALALIVSCAGAYFGEVVRRSLPGSRWHLEHHDEPDYSGWRIEFEHCFLCFNPVGAALEAVVGGARPGWNAHFALLPEDRPEVDASLDRSGGVREADYYRLTVRYEALEQALGVLERRAGGAPGGPPRRFSPAVYAAALGDAGSVIEA